LLALLSTSRKKQNQTRSIKVFYLLEKTGFMGSQNVTPNSLCQLLEQHLLLLLLL
jgi:hypothetical protein